MALPSIQTQPAAPMHACSFAQQAGRLLLAIALCIALAPSTAVADVRTSDTIAGVTVEGRGLLAVNCPTITANYAYVASEDGTVYFERDADEQVHIASVTKVMTALVALSYVDDPSNETITVSETAAAIGESSAELAAGDTLTLEAALKALMICSGNDAAYAIAESIGSTVADTLEEAGDESVPSDAYDAFIYAMNVKAEELGMENSLFANPHGLDYDEYADDMYCSARDVATMCAAAMEYGLFAEIVATSSTTISVTRDGSKTNLELESTDTLLDSYEGACGIKTGYTEKAGYCFAGAVKRDGEVLYAVILDSSSETQRFSDATELDDWVYDNTVEYPLANNTETVEYPSENGTVSAPVVANVAHTGWLNKTFKATLADPTATVEVFALAGNVSQEYEFYEVTGNVEVGQVVGTANYYQHNELIASVDIVAAEECAAPGIIERIGIWWNRLWQGLSGGATVAESTVTNEITLIYTPGTDMTEEE